MLRGFLMASAQKGNLKPRSKSTLPPGLGKNPTKLLSGGRSIKYYTPESTLISGIQKLSLNDKKKHFSEKTNKTRFGRARSLSSGCSWTKSFKSELDFVKFIKSGEARKIVVCAGAGISTGSGIPDFRTPGSGLYDNLQKYQIPYPEAIFDIDYFHHNPKPFFELAKELYPSGKYRPNYNHYFLRMLHDNEQLLRIYTQNIDGLERLAGIPSNKLVEAHGTFATATCTLCGQKHEGEEIKSAIFNDSIPKCKRKVCPGVVKPDIVFFGEDLPRRFYLYLKDMLLADLVIVMGTSLEVQPFAGIVDVTRFNVPRVLFNMVAVGPFRGRKRAHDHVIAGDLSNSVRLFVKNLGWEDKMEELIRNSEAHKQAWSKMGDNSSVVHNVHSPGVMHSGKDKPVPRACPPDSNSAPKRHYHSLNSNSAKSEGDRPRVFLGFPKREIRYGRGGLFPKLPSGSQVTRYRQQISSSSSSSSSGDSSESSDEDSR